MKTYFDFVNEFQKITCEARNIPLGAQCPRSAAGRGFERSMLGKYCACANKAIIFAPHPDDESMIGSLAIRLQKECEFEVLDVAVTLGSNKARRAGRRAELADACNYLGWGLHVCGAEGFDDIKADAKSRDPNHWNACVQEVASIIRESNPAVIFAPHTNDWNATHIGVGLLVREAIESVGADFKGLFVETEYWGAMAHPNLMIEVDAQTVAEQMTAVSCHTEEVARNDYHLRLPSWLVDNVRRGGEIVGGQGGAAPRFDFGVIYNILTLTDGKLRSAFSKGMFIGSGESISKIFG